ncbi:hypothetical protein [Glycomyces algeriensis]|uniref:Uncharacterized protein n=1 Tax=Glycomyces algeriensis TaxID=256037 RepID=A0A9W6G5J0_9ACTN|nr:hypothetical protein [Glycomyces algeriensis]MDA1367519.1 hypothetical protein [Glycomyces algeriensis]MDR7353118.1 hypothetical protein [Glycomyces algeriensis]GLI40811.1 hypothetical protein GALLR39Z86_06610 [Glycomyces algeriensis]
MNRALRIIFSRYGIVVIILILVLGVIALASQRAQTPLDGGNSSNRGSTSEASSEAFTEDDGLATENCEGDDCYPEEELPQEAVDQSVEFAEAWLNPNGYGPDGWYDSIIPFLTEDQAELLQGVDPSEVPATEITGAPVPDGLKVAFPMDTGTLTLTMTEGSNNLTGTGWLVSAIDWEQS